MNRKDKLILEGLSILISYPNDVYKKFVWARDVNELLKPNKKSKPYAPPIQKDKLSKREKKEIANVN